MDHTANPSAPPRAAAVGSNADRHHLVAEDGRHLAATWYEPAGETRAVAVASSAAGVPRGYYRVFGEWMAGRGYAVLSYDYRGIAGSRRGTMRQ